MRLVTAVLLCIFGLAACQREQAKTASKENINIVVDTAGKVTLNGKEISEAELSLRTTHPNVTRVSLYRDGRVEIDGLPTELGQVSNKLKTAAACGKSVWYYREDAERDLSPGQEKAAPVILGAVTDNKLPIRLSAKSDFSDAVDDKGISLKP